MAVVVAYYYTDPCCPWSWALEPALRRLQERFGEALNLTYVMVGMYREVGDVLPIVGQVLSAGATSQMPVDPRLWLENPPRSSYPACIAVKAAAEQGDPAPYLRRLREGLLCRRRRLDTPEALLEEARATPRLDVERFEIDLRSHAILERFGADLERGRSVAPEHRAPGREHVRLPALEFVNPQGASVVVHGVTDYDSLAAALRSAGGSESSAPPPQAIEEALRRYPTMATPEVAALCALAGPQAPARLWRLACEWLVSPERLGSGELWTLT